MGDVEGEVGCGGRRGVLTLMIGSDSGSHRTCSERDLMNEGK